MCMNKSVLYKAPFDFRLVVTLHYSRPITEKESKSLEEIKGIHPLKDFLWSLLICIEQPNINRLILIHSQCKKGVWC